MRLETQIGTDAQRPRFRCYIFIPDTLDQLCPKRIINVFYILDFAYTTYPTRLYHETKGKYKLFTDPGIWFAWSRISHLPCGTLSKVKLTKKTILDSFSDTNMRAILIRNDKGPAENLYLGEAPKPSAGAGQVLVKVNSLSASQPDLTVPRQRLRHLALIAWIYRNVKATIMLLRDRHLFWASSSPERSPKLVLVFQDGRSVMKC